ncbi:MAG TPA: hypothetical protein VHQ91_00910 [Geminicoccaceae bacterium]|jgi:hypothetical protein|nr:hypothetical protein [Geminicoccaceae bacterium]
MKKFLITLAAGAATLALCGVASAEQAKTTSADQPIVLTNQQLDGVTAGAASVSAYASGNVTVYGNYYLANVPGVYSTAYINASIIPYDPSAFASLSAYADTSY